MKTITIESKFAVCQPDELEAGERDLVERAMRATGRSYAPYSSFHVGAAALLADGSVIEGSNQAVVRPWLQAFTASYLGSGNYMEYGPDAIRAQIQAVYDAGYNEWILWDAAVGYDFSAFLSEEEAAAERAAIEESRAIQEEQERFEAELEQETFPVELQEALNGDELYESDAAVLSQDGPIVTYEDGDTD